MYISHFRQESLEGSNIAITDHVVKGSNLGDFQPLPHNSQNFVVILDVCEIQKVIHSPISRGAVKKVIKVVQT